MGSEAREMSSMFHPVKAPRHYAGDGKVECKDALKSMLYNANSPDAGLTPLMIYWWGCAFKYMWRWPWKNRRTQDLQKCRQCIDYLLEELGGKPDV